MILTSQCKNNRYIRDDSDEYIEKTQNNTVVWLDAGGTISKVNRKFILEEGELRCSGSNEQEAWVKS